LRVARLASFWLAELLEARSFTMTPRVAAVLSAGGVRTTGLYSPAANASGALSATRVARMARRDECVNMVDPCKRAPQRGSCNSVASRGRNGSGLSGSIRRPQKLTYYA